MMGFHVVQRQDPQQSPDTMQAWQLDDYAAAWARRLGLQRGTFERDPAETDASYRPRLLKMLSDTIEAP